MPLYLKQIGFSVLLICILEGIAEATAGLRKCYFGKLSDTTGRRAIFIQFGYGLSALSKPLMVAFLFPLWIFFARTLDRLGKGLRTGARDAILSDESTPETKGRVYGFHRSMDTTGAVLGPAIALVYLYFYPEDYHTLFLIAFLPGIVTVLLSLFIKDKKKTVVAGAENKRVSFFYFIKYWKESPVAYRRIVGGFLIFALFNSSDAFLLLMLKQGGLGDAQLVGAYIFYNLIYAIFAYPFGILADKWGLKRMFVFGLLCFFVVYLGMALNTGGNLYIYLIIFFIYGLYAAATEGISKAWISNLVEKKDLATAIGTYAGFQSVFAMLASTIAGLIWWLWGPLALFLSTAIVVLLVTLYFLPLNEKLDSN